MIAIESTVHVVSVNSEIKQTPSALLRIWACNQTEAEMKVQYWYNIFIWLAKKKEFAWRMTPTSATGGLEEYPVTLRKFFKKSPASIKNKEFREMMGIDVSYLDETWAYRPIIRTRVHGISQHGSKIWLFVNMTYRNHSRKS